MHLLPTSSRRALLVALVLVMCQFGALAGDSPARIEEVVLKELNGTLPTAERAAVRQFARLTVQVLEQVPEPDAAQREIIVRSVVRAVQDALEQAGPDGPPLNTLLGREWQRRRANLVAVTPEMLSRDWAALKEQYRADCGAVQELVLEFWNSRPVLLLDLVANADLAGAPLETRSRDLPVRPGERVSSVMDGPESPSHSVESRARQKLLGDVRDSLRPMLQAEDSLDCVFVMAELRYEPLSEEAKQAVRDHLERRFVLDGVIVVARRQDARLAGEDVARLLLGGELPKAPTRDARVQKIRNEFRLLARHRLLDDTVPVAFGGDVPEEMRTGRRFGIDSEATPAAFVAGDDRADFERRLTGWAFNIGQCAPLRDVLSNQLMLGMLREWIVKVQSLDEFFGDRTAQNLELRPVEQQLLSLLRRARHDNPLFTDAARPLPAQVLEFRYFLKPEDVAADRIASDAADRWGAVDRQDYLEMIDALHDWVRVQHQQATKARAEERVSRAESLLSQLEADLKGTQRLSVGERTDDPLAPIVAGLLERLERQGEWFGRVPPSAEMTPVERALEEYMRVAMKHNPMFQELGRPLGDQELRERDAAYGSAGRAVEEQQAREAALAAVEAHLRLNERQPEKGVAARPLSVGPVSVSTTGESGGEPPQAASVGGTGGGWRLPLLLAVLTVAAGSTVVACRRRVWRHVGKGASGE